MIQIYQRIGCVKLELEFLRMQSREEGKILTCRQALQSLPHSFNMKQINPFGAESYLLEIESQPSFGRIRRI